MDYSKDYNDLPTSFFDGEDEENQNDRDFIRRAPKERDDEA